MQGRKAISWGGGKIVLSQKINYPYSFSVIFLTITNSVTASESIRPHPSSVNDRCNSGVNVGVASVLTAALLLFLLVIFCDIILKRTGPTNKCVEEIQANIT